MAHTEEAQKTSAVTRRRSLWVSKRSKWFPYLEEGEEVLEILHGYTFDSPRHIGVFNRVGFGIGRLIGKVQPRGAVLTDRNIYLTQPKSWSYSMAPKKIVGKYPLGESSVTAWEDAIDVAGERIYLDYGAGPEVIHEFAEANARAAA